jgi:hypothetical protein
VESRSLVVSTVHVSAVACDEIHNQSSTRFWDLFRLVRSVAGSGALVYIVHCRVLSSCDRRNLRELHPITPPSVPGPRSSPLSLISAFQVSCRLVYMGLTALLVRKQVSIVVRSCIVSTPAFFLHPPLHSILS